MELIISNYKLHKSTNAANEMTRRSDHVAIIA